MCLANVYKGSFGMKSKDPHPVGAGSEPAPTPSQGEGTKGTKGGQTRGPAPTKSGSPKSEIKNPQSEIRRKLLAMVHIAKKELNLPQEHYEAILHGFKVESAADLTNAQLETMVKYMKQRLGWKTTGKGRGARGYGDSQVREGKKLEALRARVTAMAAGLENGEKRLEGLVRKVGKVEKLEWCRDVQKLKALLGILASIKKKEGGKP